MERYLQASSVRELFQVVYDDGTHGRKREYLKDSVALVCLLKQRDYQFEFEFPKLNLEDKPTIFAANHYIRPFFRRKSISTSGEIILTSALIGLGSRGITQRELKFVQKADIATKVVGLGCLDRKTQLAILNAYDFIPAYSLKNKNIHAAKSIVKTLHEGRNVAIYPEGSVTLTSLNGIKYLMTPDKLRQANPSFADLIKLLRKAVDNFQIIPVSVYSNGGHYLTKFHEPIRTNQQSDEIMLQIGSSLPRRMHGPYRNQIAQAYPIGN